MLRKNEELKEFNPKDPFKDDALNRQEVAERLTRLVQSTNQPFVFSIEAEWGWGKTTFIKMWKAYLESQGHFCLYFNAWDTDFTDDPLVAFIGEMDREMQKLGENSSVIKKQWNKVKHHSGKLIKTVPLIIELASLGLQTKLMVSTISKSIDVISKFVSKLAEKRIKQFSQEKIEMRDFKTSLSELATMITKDEKIKSPLIFFVDELDRCRPDYALELLERIKHLFNVNGVVFILAIDRYQISESIKSIYGSNMKTDGYLRRFIDVTIKLPLPESGDFPLFLFSRFNLGERIKNNQGFRDLYHAISGLFDRFNLSLREQEQCFTDIYLVLNTLPLRNELYYLIAIPAAIKHHNRKVFELLRKENLENEELDEIIELFGIITPETPEIWRNLRIFFEAWLIHEIQSDEKRHNRINKLTSDLKTTEPGSLQRMIIEEVLDYNRKEIPARFGVEKPIKEIVELLDFYSPALDKIEE